MDYYLDLEILPNAEMGKNIVMNVIGSRLHQFLVVEKGVELGTSFPDYSKNPRTLGKRMRLHGTSQSLDRVAQSEWLELLGDYVHVKDVQQKPKSCKYVDVRRVQAKSSVLRLARRYARRHGVSLDEALALYKNVSDKKLSYPFLSLNSNSTGQRFNLFIKQSQPHSIARAGKFNSFGLSKTASLPWF